MALDARGLAVFHSCATFNRQERKQEHVAEIGCFWFDIDAGRGKHYATALDCYREFERWRQARNLPAAVVVGSGGGIHVYWPLQNALPIQRWRVGADRLRHWADLDNLKIDAASTIDAARVLRPPGTHNRKQLNADGRKIADVGGPERPVILGPLVGPYDENDLAMLFEGMSAGEAAFVEIPDYLRDVKDNAGLVENHGDDRPSDPERIAEQCAQVRQLQQTGGNLSEPQWYAVLGVLARCGLPGRARAHTWSSGDQRYNAADTDRKLDQSLANATGPTTCAHFASLNPGLCTFCDHQGKITSPIQLGRDLSASASAPGPPDLPLLPKGFKWSGIRLCAERKPTEDDPSDIHVISEYPITLGSLQETERSKRISAAVRSWEPMQHEWREFVLNMGEIVGQSGYAKVADQGVVVPKKRWDHFLNYVGSCANEHRGTRLYGVRYEQFGWKEDESGPAFVLGNEIYRKGSPPVRIYGTEEIERRGRLMLAHGDAVAWAQAANKLIDHDGMEAHVFMLLCAFAAPLYKFTGEPGLTMVHGATRATAKGKTTIQNAGASVWGEMDATSMIERDTMVAKFITLGTLCHLPIFFDELRFPTPEETKHYVLQATLGRDKQRGKAEGGLRTDQLAWSTIHISASNPSLMDTVRYDDSEVAQAARIFEFTLSLPAHVKTTEGDALKHQMQANRGTAGRLFIKAVLDNYEWVSQAVLDRMKHYEIVMQAGPDERFVIRLFACVDVAGALVRQVGLLSIDLDKVMSWAMSVQRTNAGRLANESVTDAGAVVSEMMNDLKAGHLLVVDKPAEIGKQLNQSVHLDPRAGIKARFEKEGRHFIVDLAYARRWMQEHHYSFTEIQKEMQGLKMLIESRSRKTLGAGTQYAGGQVWCWLIDGTHPLLVDLAEGLIEKDNVVLLRGTA